MMVRHLLFDRAVTCRSGRLLPWSSVAGDDLAHGLVLNQLSDLTEAVAVPTGTGTGGTPLVLGLRPVWCAGGGRGGLLVGRDSASGLRRAVGNGAVAGGGPAGEEAQGLLGGRVGLGGVHEQDEAV